MHAAGARRMSWANAEVAGRRGSLHGLKLVKSEHVDNIDEIRVATSAEAGFPTVRVTVRATFPVIGLVGIPGAMEVTGDAPLESFD